MADSEKMSVDERYKYLRKMQKRYREANRQEKKQLLNEMEVVTELHRKSIIRLMSGALQRTKRKRERGPSYGGDVWSERVAVLGRSYRAMEDAFKRVLARLPFPIVEVHPDNGSEFLNAHLVRFWEEKARVEQLSRSRPWYKNDNRFVEQKNDTLVRAYVGYDRLDTVAQTNLLNHLYALMGLYYNFFQPVMHLAEKTVLPVEGSRYSRIRRRFDKAATPLDRLLRLADTKTLPPQQRTHLMALRAALNPR